MPNSTKTRKHSAPQNLSQKAVQRQTRRGAPVVKTHSAPQLLHLVQHMHGAATPSADVVFTMLTDNASQSTADTLIERCQTATTTLYHRTGLERAASAETILEATQITADKNSIPLPFAHSVPFSHVISPKESARLVRLIENRFPKDDPVLLLAGDCGMTIGIVTAILKGTAIPDKMAKLFCEHMTGRAQIPIIAFPAATRRNWRPIYSRDPDFLHEVQEWIIANP